MPRKTPPPTRDGILSGAIAQRLNETLLWLCSIPSPIGEEKKLCDAVQARLKKLPHVGAIMRFGDSIVAPLVTAPLLPHARPAKTRRPRIALVGHLDTVRTENGPAHLEGERCYGAGASDMKSGLATMLLLAETLVPKDLACDLTLVFYAREEGAFQDNELGVVLDRYKDLHSFDLAVCLEPSDNRLHLGCNGSVHATLTFEGKTAHSARPWEGDNAISKAAPLLAEVAARTPVEVTIDGLVYKSVFSLTQAKDGGRGRNVVPDRFLLNLNHRFVPTTSIEQAKKDILALVAGRAKVDFVDLSPAAMPNADHPLVKALRACGIRGTEPKQAWTDVARFAQIGVRAINFGPGENAQAHQKNESTSLALLHEGYGILRQWLLTLDRATEPS
jgi:succinyl-diaminopimelate desuccinylase